MPPFPNEQPQEEGPPREGEHNPYRQLVGGEQEPGGDIAQGQQRRAPQGTAQEQVPGLAADEPPDHMGDDEPHETQ